MPVKTFNAYEYVLRNAELSPTQLIHAKSKSCLFIVRMRLIIFSGCILIGEHL